MGPMQDELTIILDAIERGDQQASERLLPLVYEELRALAERRLAREQPGQTLQATALVHEAYLRLLGPEDAARPMWDGRGHFFAAAAEEKSRALRILFGGGQVSLAILQLENRSTDPEYDYLADGFTTFLTNDLHRISALRLMPEQSVRSALRQTGEEGPLRRIADELNVHGVLTGSVEWRAGREEDARNALVMLDELKLVRFICPYETATVHLALGEYEMAQAKLCEAIDVRSPCIPWMGVDPRMEVVRTDEQFLDVFERDERVGELMRRTGWERPK